MLITDSYKEMNKTLHKQNKYYGANGHKFTKHILQLSKGLGTEDILDYGCGKSTLALNLPFEIKQYDPAIEKYSDEPEAADIVVCTDVLEHIEPECLDDVLNHIYSLSKKMVFLNIHNGKAVKTLSDGRNAHLIQEDEVFWLGALLPRFHILNFVSSGIQHDETNNGVLEYIIVGAPRLSFSKNGDSKDEENGK